MSVYFKSKGVFALLSSASILATAAPTFAQATEGAALDEIVVTAQKREQNLQDVPLAVTAITPEAITQLGIVDVTDLSGLAPNTTIVGGSTTLGEAIISIRGISSPSVATFGLDTANAFYIDGVYIARSAALGLGVLDMERVEVLRGPQGTLFGRNTTGGAISFISRAPAEESGIKAEAGIGNYGAFAGKATLNTGRWGEFGDGGGFRTTLSYAHDERDGVVDNLLASDSNDPGARNTDSFRFATAIDFNDTTTLRYIADYSDVVGRARAFQLTNVADGTPRPPLTVGGVQVVQTQQAPVAQLLASGTFFEPECAALSAPTRERRDTICLSADEDATEEVFGHNLQFTKDFGNVRLKTTTGFRDWEATVGSSDLSGLGTLEVALFTPDTLLNGGPEALLPFVGVPAPFAPFVANAPVPTTTQSLFDTNQEREHEQFSQEIELGGDTDTLDWVVGAFYFKEDGTEVNPQNSLFALDTNAIFTNNFGPLGPAFVASNPAQYRGVVTNGVLSYKAKANSTALYGQFTHHFGGRGEGLSITAGGRYTWDEKTLTKFQDGTAPLPVIQTGNEDFSKFTWNLTAAYDVNDEVNIYARAATGYRSGGFNAGDKPPAGVNTLIPFEEETLTSWEAGFKSELLDRRLRLNAAAYYNRYDDLAVVIPVASETGGTFGTRFANAGEVNYLGFEVEMQAILSDNVSIDGNLGYVDVDFEEFLGGTPVVGTDPVNIADVVRAGYTSPFTANIALNYEKPLGWSDFRGRVGYTHEDGKYSFTTSITAPFNEDIKGDDRDVFDAQIGLYGIKTGGAEAFIQLWGRNLFDGEDFERGVDFGPLGYAGGYFADPRTYGIKVGFEY